MKPVMQTKRGGSLVPPEERGDCWSACLASILEVPIEAVPVPHGEEYHWWDVTQQALAPHGYEAVALSFQGFCWPEGYWIAQVPSLNLRKEDGTPEPHVVVMKGGQVAHDPCLGDRYSVGTDVGDLRVGEAFLLLPLQHRSLAA